MRTIITAEHNPLFIFTYVFRSIYRILLEQNKILVAVAYAIHFYTVYLLGPEKLNPICVLFTFCRLRFRRYCGGRFTFKVRTLYYSYLGRKKPDGDIGNILTIKAFRAPKGQVMRAKLGFHILLWMDLREIHLALYIILYFPIFLAAKHIKRVYVRATDANTSYTYMLMARIVVKMHLLTKT